MMKEREKQDWKVLSSLKFKWIKTTIQCLSKEGSNETRDGPSHFQTFRPCVGDIMCGKPTPKQLGKGYAEVEKTNNSLE